MARELTIHVWVITNDSWKVDPSSPWFILKFCHYINIFSRPPSLCSLFILIRQNYTSCMPKKNSNNYSSHKSTPKVYIATSWPALKSSKHGYGVQFVCKITSISQIQSSHDVPIHFVFFNLFSIVVCLEEEEEKKTFENVTFYHLVKKNLSILHFDKPTSSYSVVITRKPFDR